MASSPPFARRVGSVLREKWRLDALIGSGGMASVFAATHRNGMRGAIKILHPHLASNPSMRARFTREGYVANRVAHPGVVRVLDDDVCDDGAVFLVMDLLEGETLSSRARRSDKRLPLSLVIDLAAEMLDVLAAAHAVGVVHRDVKPENVFLTTDGQLKLLDFGIARLREHASSVEFTTTSSMIGTPAFMPPEQALAKWDKVDHRSDLFAVGATMWTLLTGRHVHEAESLPELLVQVSSQQARPIREVLPTIPTAVAAVIDRALMFELCSRFEDARVMREALRAAYDPTADTEPVLDEPMESAPISAFAARRRTAVLEPSLAEAAPAPVLAPTVTDVVASAIPPRGSWPSVPAESMPSAPVADGPTTLGAAAATPAMPIPKRPMRVGRTIGAIGLITVATATTGVLVHARRVSYAAQEPAAAAQAPATIATGAAAPASETATSSEAALAPATATALASDRPPSAAPSTSARATRRPPKPPTPTAPASANGTHNDRPKDPLDKFDL